MEIKLTPLICKCCGGTINPETYKCDYCDTYYDVPKPIKNVAKHVADSMSTALALHNIYTPNEMRAMLGLNRPLEVDIMYENAIKAMRKI